MLLFYIGCQKEAGRPREAEPNMTAHEPPVVPILPPPPVEEKGARIRFEKVVHDFGQVGPDTIHRCEFKFTNVGDDVLELQQPKSSCACTVGRLDKLEYAPGESSVLKVTKFKVSKKPGVKSQRLVLRTNDKTKGTVSLTVKATVVLKVAYEPKRLKLLLNEGSDACPEIKINSLDGQAFAIKDFSATGRAVTADYDTSLKATTHIIRPKINTERLQQRTRGTLSCFLIPNRKNQRKRSSRYLVTTARISKLSPFRLKEVL
jgi:hypothetical protein